MSMLDDQGLQIQVANKLAEEGLSVRETESAIRVLLDEKRGNEESEKRKEELLEVLDFSLEVGTWKSENCRHRDEDGFCMEWNWSDEPIDFMKRFAWLEMSEIEGKRYARASSKVCALCTSFLQGDELEQLQASVRDLYNAYGLHRLRSCSFYIESYCRYHSFPSKPNMPYMSGEPCMDNSGTWRINPVAPYCAVCTGYSSKGQF